MQPGIATSSLGSFVGASGRSRQALLDSIFGQPTTLEHDAGDTTGVTDVGKGVVLQQHQIGPLSVVVFLELRRCSEPATAPVYLEAT